jgi:hypothetical protein
MMQTPFCGAEREAEEARKVKATKTEGEGEMQSKGGTRSERWRESKAEEECNRVSKLALNLKQKKDNSLSPAIRRKKRAAKANLGGTARAGGHHPKVRQTGERRTRR